MVESLQSLSTMHKFIKLKHNELVCSQDNNGFTIMSYNVLAQALVSRELFPYCGKMVLKWKSRSIKIIKQIEELNPDIACLQECDQFEEFYSGKLDMLGYSYYFYKNKDKSHGCVIAFKKEKFSKIAEKSIELDETSTELLPPTMKTGNIAQFLVLKDQSGKGLTISNFHLFWRPNFDYERMRQCYIAISELKKFNKEFQYQQIMCGDFNSQPYKIVYKSITHHLPFDQIVYDRMINELNLSFKDTEIELNTLEISYKEKQLYLTNIENQLENAEKDSLINIEKEIKVTTKILIEYKRSIDELRWRLNNSELIMEPEELYNLIIKGPKLISCYKDYSIYDNSYKSLIWGHEINEPMFTNITEEFKSTLDYIFLVKDNEYECKDELTVIHLLKLPEPETFGVGLPNEIYPSDHIPVMVKMEWA
ncbi:DNase I-like protein [Neoconidiobolus thromboides FSU 785]|nr:DNase I-like protein [Neoconidiobolus thromboides FSU 785]